MNEPNAAGGYNRDLLWLLGMFLAFCWSLNL